MKKNKQFYLKSSKLNINHIIKRQGRHRTRQKKNKQNSIEIEMNVLSVMQLQNTRFYINLHTTIFIIKKR